MSALQPPAPIAPSIAAAAAAEQQLQVQLLSANAQAPKKGNGRIAPRSGLAYKHGIDTLAGVIDADYRGPVGVILANLSDEDFSIKIGDRIAQLIVEKILMPEVLE
ncbi:Dut, dUTPase [Pyrenophora tritici-repentis]|nr:Dut, dUTPase [Pyrenophora tritici-repentis]